MKTDKHQALSTEITPEEFKRGLKESMDACSHDLQESEIIHALLVSPEDYATVLANLIANGFAGKVTLKVDDNLKKGTIMAFNSEKIISAVFTFLTGGQT